MEQRQTTPFCRYYMLILFWESKQSACLSLFFFAGGLGESGCVDVGVPHRDSPCGGSRCARRTAPPPLARLTPMLTSLLPPLSLSPPSSSMMLLCAFFLLRRPGDVCDGGAPPPDLPPAAACCILTPFHLHSIHTRRGAKPRGLAAAGRRHGYSFVAFRVRCRCPTLRYFVVLLRSQACAH